VVSELATGPTGYSVAGSKPTVIFSCFATRWLWLLNQADSKMVLWQQVGHLKYTKSGYEIVLTAACAHQGCSAKE
jgi:hypothetical protein